MFLGSEVFKGAHLMLIAWKPRSEANLDEKSGRGRGRGRSRGRAAGRAGNCKGGRGRARGRASGTVELGDRKVPGRKGSAKATTKATASEKGAGKPKAKAKAGAGNANSKGKSKQQVASKASRKKKGDCKDGDKPGGDKPAGDKPGGDKPGGDKPGGGKPASGKPASGKPAGSKRKPAVEKRASESSFATPRKAARIQEHDEGMAFASPGPVNAGKFVNSTKRRAHEKRRQVAALAMGKLKTACLPCLSIPPEPFTKQSFTVRDPNKNPYASNIGVVLKATSFYVAPATIPDDLTEFIHLDNRGGCTVGWTVFPSLSIAQLGFNV